MFDLGEIKVLQAQLFSIKSQCLSVRIDQWRKALVGSIVKQGFHGDFRSYSIEVPDTYSDNGFDLSLMHIKYSVD